MNTEISRQHFLKITLAAAAASALPMVVNAAPIARKRLVAGTRVLEVNGKSARVFSLVGPDGKPGIRLGPGERFSVDLANQTTAPTIVHWHGQIPPWEQDGFPWPQTPPLETGAVRGYDYVPIPGTFWMHSHKGLQEQNLMVAPLVVHDAAELREDRQEVVLMLHDFSFRPPAEILAGLTGMSRAAARAMAQSVENVPAPKMNMASGDMSTMHMSMGMSSATMRMDLNDVNYDAFLANERTFADPDVVRIERGGRVRLRVINGASTSQFWIDLGNLIGQVVAVDGHAVRAVSGRRFPIAIAQRLDILIDVKSSGAFPILAQLEGSAQQTGILLATAGARIARIAEQTQQTTPPVDNSLERRLTAVEQLAPRTTDLVQTMTLNGNMKPYAWSINGEYWPKITPLMLTKGQRVEIELVNHSEMPHPMHLHGHAFQVVELNGQRFQGAVRDTVLVPPMQSVRIAFDANNPGRWAFHCHNLYHMVTGMMTEFRYRGIAA